MPTILQVPYVTVRGGRVIDSGTNEITLDGKTEEVYFATVRLKQAYEVLRGWSADAQAAYNDWPTMTAGQKDTALRETIRRLGIFFDRFADTLVLDKRDT